MKKIHLLCNAHLDPVWLWGKDEGIAEALSTFRVAARFCEEYDGFVFNHNESVLYEFVEEYDPGLFEKIKKLVKAGKWHIMGGWYLQPDCIMLSGEGFLKQIEYGNKYFEEKFGIKPTTAINFDPFGHTRGLVQIMKKCGYDSYVFMRPYNFVKENDFIWKGFDGSKIIGHCISGGYNTLKGEAVKRLEQAVQKAREGSNLMLWGIGNHGGGPSKIDLEAINEYIKAHPEVEIDHSWCENYFSEVDTSKLRTVDTSIVHCMVGCYTSMVEVKQAYRSLENELITCEKMLAAAGITDCTEKLEEADKALLFCQFHDILPGTAIKKAKEESLRLMSYGKEIVSRLCMKAFLKLCEGQNEGKSGEIPVLVFNPHPYTVTEEIQVDFILENQNWNDNEFTLATVYDENGNVLPTQNEKEPSSLTLDWCKRVVFKAELKPMSINRFDCKLEVKNISGRPIDKANETDTHFIFVNKDMVLHINKTTGLIDKYKIAGIDRLNADSAKISVYKDNEDPWGMTVDEFTDKIGEFELLSAKEANAFNGYGKAAYDNVRIIENGEVRTKVQATFKNGNSFAVVTYTVPKNGAYVDIKVKLFANDPNVMYKMAFNTPFKNAQFVGQTAFGNEVLRQGNKEAVYHKWCGMIGENYGVAVINKSTYGGSADKGVMNISLMRTPVYSAHPIPERHICDDDRNYDHIDMGIIELEYRLTADIERVDADAEMFNQPVYVLSFFPSGEGEKKATAVEIDNPKVILSAYKKTADGNTVMRLYNSSDSDVKTKLLVENESYEVELTPYEVKALKFQNGLVADCDLLGR